MNKIARPTQQDVAKIAGVHRTTVSLALKNSPQIPPATREKIRKLARKIGYVPDPMLSALTAYRRASRPAAFQGSLVWLVNNDPVYNYDWQIPSLKRIYEGAHLNARNHGYNMEVVNLYSDRMTPRRVAAILKARNVQGLILAPQPRPNMTMEFPWDEFSLVAIGYSLASPRLHTVEAAQYRGMRELVDRMKVRGYSRIGLAFTSNQDGKTDRNYLAGYLVGHYEQEGLSFVPPLVSFANWPEPRVFRQWYRRHRPDAIIAGHATFLEFVRQIGLRVPEDVGLACLQLVTRDGEMSGMCENLEDAGRVAVDQVVSMIMHGEKGVPKTSLHIGIEGEWVEGRTLKPLHPVITHT